MSQYFIDKLVYNNDTLDIHDTEAREMIANNTTNIQAVSARVTKNANDIDALEEITTDIREDVDNLDDRMGVAETEIDGLKTRTTNLEGRMNTAEGRLDGHDTKISDLEDRIDTAEDNITALDGRMTTAEKDIDKLEGRVDLVEDKNDEQDIAIDSLEENVAKNTADIVDIKDDLTGVHENLEDLDDRITASTYEAGIGIYFGQGVEHTNINVEDEILDQINQNTIDIQNLKTRVTNVENRLTTVEGDITNIKADIVNIKSDITSIQNDITNIRGDITTINNKITQIENNINDLDVRITALEAKTLPAGGAAGQVLKKRSATDYDTQWADDLHTDYVKITGARSGFTAPNTQRNFSLSLDNVQDAGHFWTDIQYLVPFQCSKAVVDVRPTTGAHTTITEGKVKTKLKTKTSPLEVGSISVEEILIGNIGNISIGDGVSDPHAITFTLDLSASEKALLNTLLSYVSAFDGKTTIGVPVSSNNAYVVNIEFDFIINSGTLRVRGIIPKAFIDPNVTDDYYAAAVFSLDYDIANDTTVFNYQYIGSHT